MASVKDCLQNNDCDAKMKQRKRAVTGRSGRIMKSGVGHTSHVIRLSKRTPISIVGLGYVGLATAVCFADEGYRVRGVDIDERKCNLIQNGISPIHEEGIDASLKRCIDEGNFSCNTDILNSVQDSDITFLTVGTPSRANGEIDLKYIESAAKEIGKALREKNSRHLVVVKSTVIPGTTGGLVRKTLEESSGKSFPSDFGLCFNPEFLREGSAIFDTMNPDALIVGTEDPRSGEQLLDLYREFYGKTRLPYVLVTGMPNAEFVKYSVNTFRATQLSFLNSLANLCEKIPSADIVEVTKGLSAVTKMDKRYLRAGLGYGGSCLPKDLRALTALFQKHDVDASLLLTAADVNQRQPQRAVEIAQRLLVSLERKRVAVLGITFKAGTDDIRESVAIRIVNALVNSGARVVVYDPKGMENAREVLRESVTYSDSVASCLKETECCVIATEWDEFRNIPPQIFRNEMRSPVIIDSKRILDVDSFYEEGVLVYEVGLFPRSQTLKAEPSVSAKNRN